MKFRELTIRQLENYIYSDEYKNAPVLPVTPHRAVSLAHNPSAQKDDIALIMAVDDSNIIVGYFGFLPDNICITKSRKIMWNSCWWIDPEKGKPIAMLLFYKAMEKCNKEIFFAGLTPHTVKIVEKTGFFIFPKPITGIRCYSRFATSKILPQKNNFFKYISPLLRIGDATCNFIYKIRLLNQLKNLNRNRDFQFEFIHRIDHETNDFIKQHSQSDLCRKTANELNHYIDYPWILNAPTVNDRNSDRYYFSALSKNFHNYFIKIFVNNKLSGFLFLTIRQGNVKIPYCYFGKENTSIIIKAIYFFQLKLNATDFTTFHPLLTNFILNNKSPFIYKRKIPKYFAVPKSFENINFTGFLLQDGDGDHAYT